MTERRALTTTPDDIIAIDVMHKMLVKLPIDLFFRTHPVRKTSLKKPSMLISSFQVIDESSPFNVHYFVNFAKRNKSNRKDCPNL